MKSIYNGFNNSDIHKTDTENKVIFITFSNA
jgi:hypothetical protein